MGNLLTAIGQRFSSTASGAGYDPAALPPRLAVIGLFAAALSAGINWPAFVLSCCLVLVATLLDGSRFWQFAHKRWLFWLTLLLTVYILVHTPLALRRFPALANNTYPDWSHLLAISGLASVVLGWWISRFPQLIPRLVATAGIGMAVGVMLGIQWHRLLERGMGVRRDWGYLPEEVGLFAGMALLGCVVMFLRRLGSRELSRKQRGFSGAGWLLAAAAAGTVLYGTQTRALWIGAAALTVIYILWHLNSTIRRRTGTLSAVVAAAVIAVTLAGLIQLDGAERLERRMDRGGDTIAALIALDREGVLQANPSLGERLNMWVEAMRAFTHHPITGWGIGAKVVTDKLAKLHVGWRQPHYHNLYLEFLLGLGLIGFGLFISIGALLVSPLLQRPRVARPVKHMLGLITLLTAFAFMFELQVGNDAGRAIIVWLMALLAGLAFVGSARVRRSDTTGTRLDQGDA